LFHASLNKRRRFIGVPRGNRAYHCVSLLAQYVAKAVGNAAAA
jgi:hypothetical protein